LVFVSSKAALAGYYDYGEVARSVFIAIAASYAALDLTGRVTAARGRIRLAWLSGGAVAMGLGIWAMHFKGMLAFHLPVPVEYHWPTVLASLLVAIFASAFGLYVASRQKMSWPEALTGSVIMGAGIAGLHYISMAAMRLPAITRNSPLLVTASILLAALFCLIALLMAFGLREETRWTVPRRLGSAIVMGAAVSAMHYTGMAAANFIPAPPPDLIHAVSISALGNNAIGIVTLIVLAAAMVTSSVDRRAAVEVQRLNQELEHRVLERTSQLTTSNAALGETEERFRRLVEALPDAIFVVKEERIVFVNPSAVRLLAAQRAEQIVGKELSEIIHPGSLASIRRRMRDSSQTGVASPPMEHVLVALDGSSVEIESASIPILWKGSPGIEAIARDIRERKRSEARLREYEKAVEGLEEMIVVVDRNYRYVLANRAFLNYRGLEKEQLLGRLVSEVLNPGVFEEVAKEKLDECFRGKVVTYELRYKYSQLGERDLSISYFPIESPNGIDRVACVLQDITARKQAEEQLRHAHEDLARITRVVAMGELAAAIAHEVNQPLTAIVTNANFSLRQLNSATPDTDELRGAITEIVNDGTRASAVISRIRGLLTRGAPKATEVDINRIIQDVLLLLRYELNRNRISSRTELASDLPPVQGDPVQLQQVLINLIMNAIESLRASADRPREILIRSAENPEGVLVQVEDSGPGVRPEQADRIFEPFFTSKPQGIGMGLSISRSIVESHGGRLWAAPGELQGARFQFTVPIADTSDEPAA
jgi:PAS domain S-box-containing protein